MKKILVLTPADAAGGFAIAGVRQQPAATPTLAPLVDAAIDDGEIGVLAVDERLVDAVVQARLRDLEQTWNGAIVVVPAPGKAARPQDDYALRLIRRAIGYQIRLQP